MAELEGDIKTETLGGGSISHEIIIDDTLRIIQAKPEDVSEQDLEILMKNLIDFTFLPQDVIAEEVRMKIRDRVEPLRSIVEKFNNPRLNKIFAKLQDCLYGGYTKKEHVAGSIRTIMKAFDKGIVLAVKDGERTVGIAGAVSKKKMPEGDGRDIYELTKVSVLPEYRGRKFGSKLIEERLRMVKDTYPDCPLATATRNPKAMSVYRRLGWKEVSWGDGSEIDLLIAGKKPDGSDPRWLREYENMKAKGYKTFFFDPKAPKKAE
jgi:GNAT superfamily N-acetyltransferase